MHLVPELPVLLLAVGHLVRVGAPHQTFDDDPASGGGTEQLPDGRPAGSHQLVVVTAPVGEEQMIALVQCLDLVDQPVEVGRPVDVCDDQIALVVGRYLGRRIAALGRIEEPVNGRHGLDRTQDR